MRFRFPITLPFACRVTCHEVNTVPPMFLLVGAAFQETSVRARLDGRDRRLAGEAEGLGKVQLA